MGWIHDNENDCDGFHGGFEGGAARRELSADEKAADAARFAAATAAMEEAADWTALDCDKGPNRMILVPGEYESSAMPSDKAIGFARAYGHEKGRWTEAGLELLCSWDGTKTVWPFA
jgi:hypothetical protein